MQKINVYGTGKNAVRFILENPDAEINCFIEGKMQKREFMSEYFSSVKPVVMFPDAEKELKHYYTVIASSETAYWEIKQALEDAYGLVEFDDFCYYEIYHKKMAVIYGNCHTIPIKEGLSGCREFSGIYGFYPLKPIYEIKLGGKLGPEIFEKCDLLLHQSIREANAYGSEYASSVILNCLKRDCEVIAFPNLYRMPKFLYPQMKFYDENRITWAGYNAFPFRDFYIDTNYNLPDSEIENMILDTSLIPRGEILYRKEEFFEKLQKRERAWDIKVSDFITKYLREKQLFYDPGHPTTDVLSYVIQRILEILGLKPEYMDFSSITKLNGREIPVYGSVKKALGLKYDVKYLRDGAFSNRLNHTQMDLREYIRQYKEWYLKKGM